MPYSTQVHILKLSASRRTVRTVVVFKDDKWNSPDKGWFELRFFCLLMHGCDDSLAVVQALNRYSVNGGWARSFVLDTAMFSSGEKKLAWVFRR